MKQGSGVSLLTRLWGSLIATAVLGAQATDFQGATLVEKVPLTPGGSLLVYVYDSTDSSSRGLLLGNRSESSIAVTKTTGELLATLKPGRQVAIAVDACGADGLIGLRAGAADPLLHLNCLAGRLVQIKSASVR